MTYQSLVRLCQIYSNYNYHLAPEVDTIDCGRKYEISSVRLARAELRQMLELAVSHHFLFSFSWLVKLLYNVISSLRK